MKFNRNKMGMVVILMVLLLALILSGCTAAPGSKAPEFLEVGDYYAATESPGGGGGVLIFELLEIGNDGWILVEIMHSERTSWVNTARLGMINKWEKPE